MKGGCCSVDPPGCCAAPPLVVLVSPVVCGVVLVEGRVCWWSGVPCLVLPLFSLWCSPVFVLFYPFSCCFASPFFLCVAVSVAGGEVRCLLCCGSVVVVVLQRVMGGGVCCEWRRGAVL